MVKEVHPRRVLFPEEHARGGGSLNYVVVPHNQSHRNTKGKDGRRDTSEPGQILEKKDWIRVRLPRSEEGGVFYKAYLGELPRH